MRKACVVPGRNLDPVLTGAWRSIQRANPDLSNPLFSPEFTTTIAAVRDDVEVAVIVENERPVAFFPFQRCPSDRSRAIPVGDFLSDFQALICEPNYELNPFQLLKECGLASYAFSKFLASQKAFVPFHHSQELSPQMDLSQGYEAYAEERREAGSKLINDCLRKARRMEQEVGPPRFIAHSTDLKLLQEVLTMKQNQYIRTGVRDILAIDWVRAVTETIHATQTINFSGMLSLLYAGDRLVAGHFGMRSQTVLHYFLPVYDTEMAKYSPGFNLLLKMAAYAPSSGIRTLDLDRGRSEYKMRLKSKAIMVADGRIDRRYSRRIARRARYLRKIVGNSPFASPARLLMRLVRGA